MPSKHMIIHVVILVIVTQGSSSRVLLNFSGESELRSILRECLHRNVTGLQLIASEAWATSKSLWREFGGLLTGTLGFGIRKADVIPGLKDFLTRLGPSHGRQSAFLAEFWEETFNCRVNDSLNTHTHSVSYLDREPCSGREVLGDVYTPFADVSQLRVSYNVYKAVYLIAHALQDMTNCVAGQGPFINGTCGDPKHVKPWQVSLWLKILCSLLLNRCHCLFLICTHAYTHTPVGGVECIVSRVTLSTPLSPATTLHEAGEVFHTRGGGQL